MEVKRGVEGCELVNLLEVFSAAAAANCGFDFVGLDPCRTSFMHLR